MDARSSRAEEANETEAWRQLMFYLGGQKIKDSLNILADAGRIAGIAGK
jgi:hypothetical protein